jgi:hypothetical protein
VPRSLRPSRATLFVSQLASETWNGWLGRPLPTSNCQRDDEATRAGYLEHGDTAAITDDVCEGDSGLGVRSSSEHSPVSERIEILERRCFPPSTTRAVSRATTDRGRQVLPRAFIARRTDPLGSRRRDSGVVPRSSPNSSSSGSLLGS